MSKTTKSETQERLRKEKAEQLAKMAKQKADRLAAEAKKNDELEQPASASQLFISRCANSRRMLKKRPALN